MKNTDTLIMHQFLREVLMSPGVLIEALKDQCMCRHSPESWISAVHAINVLHEAGIELPCVDRRGDGWSFHLPFSIDTPDGKVTGELDFKLNADLAVTDMLVVFNIRGHKLLTRLHEWNLCSPVSVGQGLESICLKGVEWGAFGSNGVLLDIVVESVLSGLLNTADLDSLMVLYATTNAREHDLVVTVNEIPYRTLTPNQSLALPALPGTVIDFIALAAELFSAQQPEARRIDFQLDEGDSTLSVSIESTDLMRG